MLVPRFYLLGVLIIGSFSVRAQTSGGIIENYLNAIGGKEKIDSIKTIVFKTSTDNPFGKSSATIFSKRNNKYRIEMSYRDGRKTINCFNGSKYTGSNRKVVEMLENYPSKVPPILFFSDLFFVPEQELQLLPPEKLNGTDCHVLSFCEEVWDRSYKYYFNAYTHLLIAEENNLLV